MVGVYIVFLHNVQLHVSVLDNGHLQVVHEILIKQLYKTYMGCIHGACRRGGGHEVCRRGGGHEISYIS